MKCIATRRALRVGSDKMAALSDIDLIRILGEDARAQIEAASANRSDDPEMSGKKRLLVLENRQFTAFALILMGVVLFISAYYTQIGTTFTVQCWVAGVILFGGLAWNMMLSMQKKNL
jgi:hypothetical protein